MSIGQILLNLREYHRPADDGATGGLDRALDLLSRPEIHTAPLAGGDTLVGSGDPTIEAVVDLQGLGLDTIRVAADPPALHIGAMVTRAALSAHAAAAPDPLAEFLARASAAWGGSVQRNRATVGGAVATAAADDALVIALLTCDAQVVLYTWGGFRALPLTQFLPSRGDLLAEPALLTEVVVPFAAGQAGHGLAAVARTPSDRPIVLAAAAISLEGGRCTAARLAVGGVAELPIRVPEAEAVLAGQVLADDLITETGTRAATLIHPAGDFRGSAEYRRAMVEVLAGRGLRAAWHDAE